MKANEIEQLRQQIQLSKISLGKENRLHFYFFYYSQLLETNNSNIIEGYATEFISDYLECIDKLQDLILSPEQLKSLTTQLETLNTLDCLSGYEEDFENAIHSLEKKYKLLSEILNGKTITSNENKLKFPLLAN